MYQLSLDGKVALITGASRGIGRAIALALADAGADLAICARNLPPLEEVAQEITAKGRQALALSVNVRHKEDLVNLVDKTMERFGRIDILVNNAGINFTLGSILDLEEWAWDNVMNTNLKAPFLLSQMVGKIMVQQKSGNIINVASIEGLRASPVMGAYSVSKAALEMLSRVLAADLRRHNIRVNTISPGLVRTEFARPLWEGRGREGAPEIPAWQRLAEPEEIAGIVVFLCSDAASFISGDNIVLDNGASA